MATSLSTLIRLRAIQNKTRQLFENLNDIQYRLQYHPDLSPAGWYLGNGLFIENFWLHECMQNNTQFTQNKSLYAAALCPKAEQGPRLPPLQSLLQNMPSQQDDNDLFLMEVIPPLSDHPLFKNEYIENFIIQNYAHNFEAIHMVLAQAALKLQQKKHQPQPYPVKSVLQPQALIKNISHIDAGDYEVGGEWPLSLDNELPAHKIHVPAFSIANTPVSNGQFLRFIEDGGYHNKKLWNDAGWQWREDRQIQRPQYWCQNPQQHWYGVNHQGPHDLNINDAVNGLSHYEAIAFANWAHARLPHEHEWETAAKLEKIKCTTDVWEWCSNTFSPYAGFKPFPFDLPTKNEFSEQHYILKGASQYTRPELKRAAFRNAYLPHQRHMFAGLRLVFD